MICLILLAFKPTGCTTLPPKCCCANLAFNESKKLCPGPFCCCWGLATWGDVSSEFLREARGLKLGANFALSDAIKFEPTFPGPKWRQTVNCLVKLALCLVKYHQIFGPHFAIENSWFVWRHLDCRPLLGTVGRTLHHPIATNTKPKIYHLLLTIYRMLQIWCVSIAISHWAI